MRIITIKETRNELLKSKLSRFLILVWELLCTGSVLKLSRFLKLDHSKCYEDAASYHIDLLGGGNQSKIAKKYLSSAGS
jgi:hypothetical protein